LQPWREIKPCIDMIRAQTGRLLQVTFLIKLQSPIGKRCDIFLYRIIFGIFLLHGLVMVLP
jgi:hypothetical protein